MDYNIDFDRIEAEIIACAGLCVNDFNNATKDILLVHSTNAELIKMLMRFNAKVHCVGFNGAEVADFAPRVAFYDLAINLKISKFDVIIDLQNGGGADGVANYQKLLKNNGILIMRVESLAREAIAQKSANFNVLMPFVLQSWGRENATDSTHKKYYIFASNKFHPIADFSLQKLDMLEDLQYCNARIYEAAFALPNAVKAQLKGIVRN